MIEPIKKFWIVLRDPTSQRIYKSNLVTRTHDDEQNASFEAERLARQEHDNFYVMEAISVVGPSDVKWTEIVDE